MRIYANDMYPKAKQKLRELGRKQICLYLIVMACLIFHFLMSTIKNVINHSDMKKTLTYPIIRIDEAM